MSSASTGRALAPQVPASATSPTNPQAPSLTQKTWVIPPRPKPGRKPATDMPSSRRKAQNRVAQRAFRERKAAKIDELQDEMDQMATYHQTEVNELKEQLQSLNSKLDHGLVDGVDTFNQSIISLRHELEDWKASYEQERKMRESLERELAILKGEAVSLPRRHDTNRNASHKMAGTLPAAVKPDGMAGEVPLGCGSCSLTHCQCLEEVLNYNVVDGTAKRPLSPSLSAGPAGKKTRPTTTASNFVVPSDEAETISAVGGRCGFCKDGTTCYCAELAMERAQTAQGLSSLPSPPSDEHLHETMRATEIDFTTSAPTTNDPSAKGPGTCEQCRNDPTSKGFCKGLASMRASGSLHNSSADTVSCSRAFTTLKQHPAFSQASKNFQEWLPQLVTVPRAGPEEPSPARHGFSPFEIESASVLGVLKFFDRRFGREP